MTNIIGLDNVNARNIADELNKLLANYSYFYQNTRGGHWNVKGTDFFELHEVFEVLYTDIAVKIDEIAERILTLGFTPNHNFTDYSKLSTIKEAESTSDADKLMADVLNSFRIILEQQRKILNLTDELADEGTNALMSDFISDYEKRVWMFSAYLNK